MSMLSEQILAHADASQAAGLSRFFKCGPGQYGEGDQFLGIKVPVTRSVVKAVWENTSMPELQECVASPFHEMRLAALLVLVEKFSHSRKQPDEQRRCVEFYLDNTEYVNNWDLVDLSCYQLLGQWLMDKDRKLLYTLAENGKTIWEQRIGMVSTMQFLRAGQLDDTYAIAQLFLDKPQPLHDLLQKACGWLLREAGKRDEHRLKEWLDTRRLQMPRTMLRYAIERLPESERRRLMAR